MTIRDISRLTIPSTLCNSNEPMRRIPSLHRRRWPTAEEENRRLYPSTTHQDSWSEPLNHREGSAPADSPPEVHARGRDARDPVRIREDFRDRLLHSHSNRGISTVMIASVLLRKNLLLIPRPLQWCSMASIRLTTIRRIILMRILHGSIQHHIGRRSRLLHSRAVFSALLRYNPTDPMVKARPRLGDRPLRCAWTAAHR